MCIAPTMKYKRSLVELYFIVETSMVKSNHVFFRGASSTQRQMRHTHSQPAQLKFTSQVLVFTRRASLKLSELLVRYQSRSTTTDCRWVIGLRASVKLSTKFPTILHIKQR